MDKLKNTWVLMKASWTVLMKQKKLIIFPIVSGICCLIIIGTFFLKFRGSGVLQIPEYSLIPPIDQQIVLYRIFFILYFLNYLVIIFFNTALVACTASYLDG